MKPQRHSLGLGGNIHESFVRYIVSPVEYTEAGTKETSGNGSLMRLAPVPICFYNNVKQAQIIARNQSLVTHQGEEAAECCRLLAFVIVKLIKGDELKDALDHLGEDFDTGNSGVQALAASEMEGDDFDRDWRWKADTYKYSPTRSRDQPGYVGSYSMDALSMALHCAWSTNSAKEAVLKAVNLCGDADTVGSITGQIVGAAYGVNQFPSDWINKVRQWDCDDSALRAHYLFHMFDPQ